MVHKSSLSAWLLCGTKILVSVCCRLTHHFLHGTAGGKWTGAALNPARVIGPLAVFKCGRDVAWIYVLAQLLAAILACSIFAFVSGWGPLAPIASPKRLGITYSEAVRMWITGVWVDMFKH